MLSGAMLFATRTTSRSRSIPTLPTPTPLTQPRIIAYLKGHTAC